ncbi:MAG: ABC transporter permease, partial [Chitinophagaceae bacterium]|nr:ABC transporter permease [Chitinophagaceae bacterium]
MNELQMKYISNKKPGPEDNPYVISREHWKELPDFHYQFSSFTAIVRQQSIAWISLLCWLFFLVMVIAFLSNKLKAK